MLLLLRSILRDIVEQREDGEHLGSTSLGELAALALTEGEYADAPYVKHKKTVENLFSTVSVFIFLFFVFLGEEDFQGLLIMGLAQGVADEEEDEGAANAQNNLVQVQHFNLQGHGDAVN